MTRSSCEAVRPILSSKLRQYPSILTGESTPSYLFHYDLVIPRIQRYVHGHHIYSLSFATHGQGFLAVPHGDINGGDAGPAGARGASEYSDMTFKEVVEAEIAELEAKGVHEDGYTSQDFARDIVSTWPMGHEDTVSSRGVSMPCN